MEDLSEICARMIAAQQKTCNEEGVMITIQSIEERGITEQY